MKIKTTIEHKLREALTPEYLDVVDESHGHNVPAGSESHFKVIAASDSFTGQSRVRRHQAVYQLLAEELDGPVHALALHLFTPEEWQGQQRDLSSPPCLGGSKGR